MRRSDAAMARRVGDEIVILDVNSGQYFGLNEVGAFIWDQLESDTAREALIAAVTASYDIDTDRATADIDALVADLVARGLIEP